MVGKKIKVDVITTAMLINTLGIAGIQLRPANFKEDEKNIIFKIRI